MEYLVPMSPNFACDFYEMIPTNKGRIYIWKPFEADEANQNRTNKREMERSELIRMFQALNYPIDQFYYKESGQPMITAASEEFISLSHANGWYAVYISEEPVGIDIETERPTISAGRSWFVNAFEEENFSTAEELHIIWGAKEAFYKKLEGQIPDLKSEVTITQINPTQVSMLYNEQTEVLFHKKIGNAYVVWTS